MWGLDAADPQVAIAAMQAMNASVRNAVFAPAFFGMPLVLLVTALANRRTSGAAALAFAVAAVVYTLGGLVLTLAVNVPMNEALAQVIIPEDRAEAAAIWAGYSPRWQLWNQIRTVASGVALLLAGWGTWRLGRDGGR
ncbi:anthrone oxygenase family protein [uncultured Paracoccus sp.]|uniref:anthrone oxygenase family protein n=1 Tax=uncultured Paracoccus sp. TaxID=189685 RepID=UPI00262D8232|nr:anthrone oxygenase family protein [uncultured Paracoccus sp.]